MPGRLDEAYRAQLVVGGDLLSIRTGMGTEKFIYLTYLQGQRLHHLVTYPLNKIAILNKDVFCGEDEIIEWEKIGHMTPEQMKEEMGR
jgi:hypothetical protein